MTIKIVDWLDDITELFALPYAGDTQRLRTYKLAKAEQWPTSIETPCVLTFTDNDSGFYASDLGSQSLVIGVSEFHLAPTYDESKIPFMYTFWDAIIEVAATNLGLNNPDKIIDTFDGVDESNQRSPTLLFIGYWTSLIGAIGFLLLYPGLGGKTLAQEVIELQDSKDEKISNNTFIKWVNPKITAIFLSCSIASIVTKFAPSNNDFATVNSLLASLIGTEIMF